MQLLLLICFAAIGVCVFVHRLRLMHFFILGDNAMDDIVVYKKDFMDSVKLYDSELKLVFGIDSKDTVIRDRFGLMLFEYISKGKGCYTINGKKVKFRQGDAFLFKPWENVKVMSTETAERIYIAYIPHRGDSISQVLDKNRKCSGAYCKELMFNFFDVLQKTEKVPTAIAHLFFNNLYLSVYKPKGQKRKDKKAEEKYNSIIK